MDEHQEARPAPTPIRPVRPAAARTPSTADPVALPPLPRGAGWGQGSAPPPSPDEDTAPRFIPLALAIEMDMTPPIGSIRTTPVELAPSEARTSPRPTRRHLRLLPSPGV